MAGGGNNGGGNNGGGNNGSGSGAINDSSIGKIVIGDSRTVGMKPYINTPNTYVVAQVSAGYSYLTSTCRSEINRIMSSHSDVKDWIIITWFGVNDVSNAANYASYYGQLKGIATVVVCSVGPGQSMYVNDSLISSFNSRVKGSGNKDVDVYSYLKSNGYNSSDGLHYDGATYQKIWNYIKQNV